MPKRSGRRIRSSSAVPVASRTERVRIDPKRPDKSALGRAARIIRGGGLVAFPTETVYGIAADRTSGRAIRRLYKVKDRPKGKPLTVHVAGLGMLRKMKCPLRGYAKRFVEKYWPGPLTVILRAEDGRKIGFRMPDNRVALELIRRAGVPVVAPSANMSGRTPPTDAESVLVDLDGKIDMVLDAGPTSVGIESTVVDCTGRSFRILRQGAVSEDTLNTLYLHGE